MDLPRLCPDNQRAGTRPTPRVSNPIVARPFQGVPFCPCTRLKPRTTFVCRCTASCSATLQGRAALCKGLKPRTTFVERAGTGPTPSFCRANVKTSKHVSYGPGHINVYWRRMLLGLVPSRSFFRIIGRKSPRILTNLSE